MRLGVGIIGLGVGTAHVVSLNGHSGAEVRWICDLDQARCGRVQAVVPSASVTTNWLQVVRAPDVDLVVIATPDNLHAEMIQMAIENQKHVFCEKPICTNLNEFETIRRLLKANPNCFFSSNMVLRASPVFNELRRAMAKGSLGRISHVEASYLYGRFHKILQGWRGNEVEYSAMLAGGIHMIDLAMWLLQERPVSVFGAGHSDASESRGHKFDDLELGILKFASGVTASITSVMASSTPHSHVVSVHGTKETFMLSPLGCGYLNSDALDFNRRFQVSNKYNRGLIVKTFVDQILGLGPPIVNVDEVLDCTAVALATRESIFTGGLVAIKYA